MSQQKEKSPAFRSYGSSAALLLLILTVATGALLASTPEIAKPLMVKYYRAVYLAEVTPNT